MKKFKKVFKAVQVANIATSAVAFGVSQLSGSLEELAKAYQVRMKEEFGLDITIFVNKQVDMFGARIGGYAYTMTGNTDTVFVNFDDELEFDYLAAMLKMSRKTLFEAIVAHEMGHIEAMLTGELTRESYVSSKEDLLYQEKLAWEYGKKYCPKRYRWAFHFMNAASYAEYKVHKAQKIVNLNK